MNETKITLAHGSGTQASHSLISSLFLKHFGNKTLNKLDDAATLRIPQEKIAFTTDAFTVKPLFFHGGDIGTLAVCGTLNDLAVQGAQAKALAVSFIIEEGFPIKDLERIALSIARCAKKNNVIIATGDTKVVSKGEADGIFITTTGIGVIGNNFNLSCSNVKAGDAVIVSGTIGEHGISIINAREQLGFQPVVRSDVACVYPLIKKCLPYARFIHAIRDPTRGGLISVLHEIALASRVGIRLNEKKIPVQKHIIAACELLGFDYCSVANEGKAIFFVDGKKAREIVSRLRQYPLGKKASIIGFVNRSRKVNMITKVGTERLIMYPQGELLPRIC